MEKNLIKKKRQFLYLYDGNDMVSSPVILPTLRFQLRMKKLNHPNIL